jgi:hypothetical protein
MAHAKGRRDMEATFLSFDITPMDGRFHDGRVLEDFRVALLRAGQAWDQLDAHRREQRRRGRESDFRHQLEKLFQRPAYAGLDGAVKERLLAEVPALAFGQRELGG